MNCTQWKCSHFISSYFLSMELLSLLTFLCSCFFTNSLVKHGFKTYKDMTKTMKMWFWNPRSCFFTNSLVKHGFEAYEDIIETMKTWFWNSRSCFFTSSLVGHGLEAYNNMCWSHEDMVLKPMIFYNSLVKHGLEAYENMISKPCLDDFEIHVPASLQILWLSMVLKLRKT